MKDEIKRESITVEAADWFARLESEDATEADWQNFATWLAEDPDHGRAYDKIEGLTIEIEFSARHLRDALVLRHPKREAPRLRPAGAKRLGWWFAVAASAAAAAAAVTYIMLPRRPAASFFPREKSQEVAYAAARGTQREVVLKDGTRLRLDGGTVLSVSWSKTIRRIDMASGEASFDVAKDPRRPFEVALGDRVVRVVGTEFDIVREGRRVAVTVRRGLVAVSDPSKPEHQALLRPGQRLVHHVGSADADISQVDADKAFTWRQGYRVYQRAPLSEVTADLSRAFPERVVATTDTADLRFTGVLMLDSEDAVVSRLEAFLPVRADRNGGEVVFRRADRPKGSTRGE